MLPQSNSNVISPFNPLKRDAKNTLRRQALDQLGHDIDVKVNNLKAYHINETVDIVVPMLLNQLELAGFPINPSNEDENFFIKDCTLILESVRAMLCKYYGIFHPMQRIADKLFVLDESGYFKDLPEKVTVKLSPPKSRTIFVNPDATSEDEDE
jgi:hypothetical protein